MKVLHVISGLSDGGAEAVLYRLVTNDLSDSHHVISLTGEGKYGRMLRDAGVAVTFLDMARGRVTLRGLRKLLSTVRSTSADVIQTWMYHSDLLGGLAGRLAGIPVVWGLRNTVLEPGKSSSITIFTARLCAWLSRWVPERIVACAQVAVSVHAALGYEADRMVVIPNGFELSRFERTRGSRDRLRTEWEIPAGVPLLGMVARFDPYKDHDNLLAALAVLEERGVDFRAVLVGTGVSFDNGVLMDKVQAIGLTSRIILLGARHDIPDIMGAIDVHVLSSSAEAFPNVVAEAMACGTPCVTTDVGEAARIIGGTGWVVPPRIPSALASAMAIALNRWRSPVEWADRQQRCRQRIKEEYSLEKMIKRYREIWAEAVTQRYVS